MTDDKWQRLVDLAKKNFRGVTLNSEELIRQSEDGPIRQGTVDILVFENAKGRYKLARINKPKVLSKKEHYSHRAGDTSRTEYVTSDTEVTHQLKVYEDTGYDDWEEITLDSLGL